VVGLCLVCALPVAFVLGSSYSRNPEVRGYLSSLTRLRGVWGWALIALAFSPLLMLLTMGISHLLGREPFSIPRLPVSGLALVVVVIIKFLYQWFFFNATGEEAGWRGFVQNRLQAKLSPLFALLIMGFFWPIWHFFLWQAEGSPVSSLEWWAQQYLALIPATVFITWFYNRSKGSILVAGVAHASANTAFAFFQNLDLLVFNISVGVVAVVMILIDKMWQKMPPEHPAVYRSE
jgi:membrane protease YdiL (CAAX protease family)